MSKKTKKTFQGIVFTTLTMLGVVSVLIGTDMLQYSQTNLLNFVSKEISSVNNTQPLNSTSAIDSHDNIVIAWEGVNNDSRAHNIFFKKIDFNGEIYKNSQTCGEGQTPILSFGEYKNHYLPSVASDKDGNFTIVWQADHPENHNDILMQRFDTNCNPIDSTVVVNTTLEGEQLNPSISINPETQDFVITWEQDGKILARRGSSQGAFLDGLDRQINDESVTNNHNPRVKMDSTGQFIITWDGQSPEDDAGVFLQYFNQVGFPATKGNQLVNSYIKGPQIRPSITSVEHNKKFIITWEGEGNSDDQGVFGKTINSCNSEQCLISSIEFPINTDKEGIQHRPSIAADYQGNFAVIWKSSHEDKNTLHFQGFSAKGSRFGQEEVITDKIIGLHHQPALSMDQKGDYTVTWNEEMKINFKSYISSFNKKNGEHQANTFTDNTQDNPTIASTSDGSRTVIAWEGDNGSYLDQQGIFFNLYDKKGDIINEKEGILANKYTMGSQNRPQVAMFDNGEFIICWDGEGPNDKQGIFYQKFNSDGTPNGLLLRANPNTEGTQFFCNIATSPKNIGNFAIVWDGESTKDNQGVSGVFFKDYEPTEEIQINSITEGFQGEPQVAISDPSKIVVIWTSETELTTQNIFGQQFNIEGTPIGENFLVNDNTAATQQSPSIAFGDEKTFITTWHEISTDEEEETHSIKAKTYQFEDSANPTVTTPDFLVNTSPHNINSSPSVSADHYNNFIISWTHTEIDDPENFSEIAFKAYSNKNGVNQITPQLQANSTYPGPQNSSQVNLQGSSSNFTIIWAGAGPNDPQGIFAQNYTTIFDTQDVFLSAISEQEIVSAGRSLIVPEIAELQPVQVSLDKQENKIIFKNADTSKPVTFEIKDLLADENPYNVSVEATNMIYEKDQKSYIPASAFFIKNSTSNNPIETIRGAPGEVLLDDSTSNFTSLIDPQIIAVGKGENFGIWHFLPELKIIIPELTPPGKHTGGLIFSLN